MNSLSWEEKNLICKAKGLHIKFTEQIEDYPDKYNDKIKRLEEIKKIEFEQYADLLLKHSNKIKKKDLEELDSIRLINEKITRLRDKQNAVIYELDGRRLGYFKDRKPHGTIYYIDLDGGNDGNTGLTTAQAWRTIEQYTVTTVRTPGDIAYVRANTAEIAAGIINFDEDGNADNRLYLIGCDSVVNDPWGDGSDVLPIINFNNGNAYCYFVTDDFWWIERFDIQNYNNTAGGIYSNISRSLYVKDCKFHDNNNGGGIGIYILRSPDAVLDGIEVYDNNRYGLRISQNENVKIINSVFNAGAIHPEQYAIYGDGRLEIENTSIGQTTPHTVGGVYAVQGFFKINMRNCIWNRNLVLDAYSNIIVFEEDVQGVFGDQLLTTTRNNLIGTVERDTAITRAGGASSSAKMIPDVAVGLNLPLSLNGNELFGKPLNWYLVAGTAYTITTFIRATDAWAVYPTADELYVEYSYLSNAASAARSTIRSAQVLNHPSNWQSFTVTFTPLQDGWAYGDVFLKVYEAGKSINVDLKQSVT